MKAKHFIIFLMVTLLFCLHLIPAILIVGYKADSGWGGLYALCIVLDIMFGVLLGEKWDDIYNR